MILRAQNITKRFPGVTALKDVSFDLREGEIHALCGENGAGKSTLIKLLSGIHPHGSYEGRFDVTGEEARFATIKDAERAGLAVIYQELALVEEMTVAENIFLGREPHRWGVFIDWPRMYREAQALLNRFKVDLDPAAPVRTLGVGQKQLVEIIKALAKNSKILILDEPTAALAEHEVLILLDILRDLRQRGIASIYISHKLDEVFGIADRITVLRDGSTVCTSNATDTSKTEVIRQMVGREIGDLFPRRTSQPGEVILRVDSLSVADAETGSPRLHDISFELRAGEVLGIGGLMGAGRTELLMHLFGAWGRHVSGSMQLHGQPLGGLTPETIIQRGLVLASEDRRRYGLHLEQEIGFNLSLSSLASVTRGGFIQRNAEIRRNQSMFDSLRVKATGLEAVVGKLSGGNQQKVVLGKALLTEPTVILLDEPTRGIDVGAKLEIYEIINQLTAAGKAVTLVSSELPELIGMSDRILMLNAGRVGGAFSRAEATQEKLMAAAMGHAG
ncbi:sugar ABC transporter ATP-binding protein [Prosthecobacter sp.]|uniref:sugar ABC transporter ATP-binding protein n=1 Tax=Prosthecobacter sp. TaxID=1965333 RepID=UPI0024895A0A|nr:sugar ABC transporter ATP-binding protein [Prosthecobacter sp.]MDI1315293.1 sugar ABC transporter ATP-binding protein [Prosthecobacter sp.]